MAKRTDIKSILVIGSGPIVIGQACEFDYSGTQAIRVLREEGYRVVLVNSNPATIMTDPEFSDATYIEPITADVIEQIIVKERPDAVLPTLGGQTALNVTMELAERGTFDRWGVELIGAGVDSIRKAEDRGLFKEAMEAVGISVAQGEYATDMETAIVGARTIGYPVMIRPSFILGGEGTGVALDEEEFLAKAAIGLAASPVGEILVEESVLGWKEFELEVMRDKADNAVIVCSIENLDAMGVHTGDSITVAPIQTLTDREYQEMRNEAIAVLRTIGVETGGSNVQFAVDPETGRRIVIEMNPRVSRSSALASKATGFPIAKIAALLAVGYTLDEISNDITGKTPASFEPALDYVVVKVPRFEFSKFPSASGVLGTSMQSVGEAMAMGRTFQEALQKALRSLETGRAGLNADAAELGLRGLSASDLKEALSSPTPDRIYAVGEALRVGTPVEEVSDLTGYDPWFVNEIGGIVEVRSALDESALLGAAGDPQARSVLELAKRTGFSDDQIGYLWQRPREFVANLRASWGIERTYKTVDTCAAEFSASTPYFYSTFEDESEVPPADKPTVLVLGSGPNRIGQGIEFDYCCVHASFALKDAGYESVMVNCNPETVSTDYDTSDRLYFEPLTVEDVLAVVDSENPVGVIVQLGGQTPLGLANALAEAGVPIAGTSPASIDAAEDRQLFSELCKELGVLQPAHGIATSADEAAEVAERIGFPLLVRPSYVLGGKGMRVVYGYDGLSEYLADMKSKFDLDLSAGPLLLDRFLESAVEVDVDAIYDGTELLIGGIMEHVEEAGVHSGDSACVTPPPTLSPAAHDRIVADTEKLAKGLGVRGLINIQFAARRDDVYVLEANPRGSRTVPFISKATGIPLAKIATRVMMGESLKTLRTAGVLQDRQQSFSAVKEAVLPWSRFPQEDIILGPEMRSTGEVMGISNSHEVAFSKAMLAAGMQLPDKGNVFFSLADRDKVRGLEAAKGLQQLGFSLVSTEGTSAFLEANGVESASIPKLSGGEGNTLDWIERGAIDMVVNTPRGQQARSDGRLIRTAAQRAGVPCITTIEGALATVGSLQFGPERVFEVKSLQDWLA